jgi:hypothetical protein
MLPAQGHTWLDLAASLGLPPNLSLSDDRRSADGRWPVDNGTRVFDVAVHQVRASNAGSEPHRAGEGGDAVWDSVLHALRPLLCVLDKRRAHQLPCQH